MEGIEGGVLYSLLIISTVFGVLLAFMSTAALGRTIADLQRQTARGIVGRAKIQTWVNLRSYGKEAALGIVFVVINILLIFDTPQILRQWTNRGLWTILLGAYVTIAAIDWIAERVQVELSAKELAQIEEREEDLIQQIVGAQDINIGEDQKSYIDIAEESVRKLEEATDRILTYRGDPPITPMAPVVAEHSSPVTEQQTATAKLATLRARLVAAAKALSNEKDTEE